MKILFVIKALDDIQGGAERVLVDISSGLANKGHDVSILSFDRSGGQSFYPLNKKVKRVSLGIGNARGKTTISEAMARMVAIRKTTRDMNPDIVIAFMHSAFIPASFALAGTGVPVIASEHIVPDHYKNKKIEYLLFILSRYFVKRITVLSSSIIESYSPILRSKMSVIENPVHAAKLQADPIGKQKCKKIILNVGRLTDQKDQETLIKAFAIIADDYPDWNLRIIGEGELRDGLEDTILSLNLKTRVFLPGVTSKIEKEYQAAQIFALPSKYESFGLATAEAMAHGLPTIGFASCPGTNELIIHGENGLLIADGDRAGNFAQGLRQLINSDTSRKAMGAAGLKTIKPFKPDTIVEKWEMLIKASLKKNI